MRQVLPGDPSPEAVQEVVESLQCWMDHSKDLNYAESLIEECLAKLTGTEGE